MATDPLDLSICIITLNEARNIERCLSSLPRGCEVIVLDSGSSDGTVRLATDAGASVHSRDFDDYSSQKNAALRLATRSWVLFLDADEVCDEVLGEEIRQFIVSAPPRNRAFRVRRQLVFMGQRMRYGKTSDRPLRFFPRTAASFRGAIHEQAVVEQGVEVDTWASGSILHFSYEDLSDYFSKFNNYTSRIAQRHFSEGKPVGVSHVFRPWVEFINRYFVRLGFLDGYPGYCYALNSSLYAFVKYAKLRELCQEPDPK